MTPLFARIVIDLGAFWEFDRTVAIVEFHRALIMLFSLLRKEVRCGKQIVVCVGLDSSVTSRELAVAGQHLGLSVASGERALDVIGSVLGCSRVPTLVISSHAASPQFLSDFPVPICLMSDIVEAKIVGAAGWWARTKVLPSDWVTGLAISGFRTCRSALDSRDVPDPDLIAEFKSVACDVTIKRVEPDLAAHRAWLVEEGAMICLQPDMWKRIERLIA